MTPHPSIALVTLHAGFHHSSLALRSLAACCRGEPFAAGIRIVEPTIKADLDSIAAEIAAHRPRIVGFSTYLWNIDLTLALAARLKVRLPGMETVFGGPEAGPRGEALVARHRSVDFVVDGEGELAFRDLARQRLLGRGKLEAVSGLVWRDRGLVRRNPIAPVPPEALVSPFTEGLLDSSKPLIYWETSRGCPFRCSFCTSAGDRLRTFPEARIEADLQVIGKLEHKTVKLLDRSFHLGAKRTLKLLQRFLDTPESLRFHLELNPDRISPEAMALFADAPPGKFQFEIGLQTLEPEVLARIDRQMDIPKGLDNIRALVAMRRHPVHLDIIVGLPEEDAGRCRDSLDRVFLLFADHLQLGTLKLLPGTALRAQADRFGYRFDPDPPYEVYSHDALDAAAFVRFKRYAELLERLWNSGLLRRTLAYWVPYHWGGRVSRLFDTLIAAAPDLAQSRPPPERVFAAVADLLQAQGADPALRELFAWDYGHFALPGKTAPALVQGAVEWQTVAVEGHRKRLPVFSVGQAAAEVISGQQLEPMAPGRFALWPRKHRKGRPVARVRVG